MCSILLLELVVITELLLTMCSILLLELLVMNCRLPCVVFSSCSLCLLLVIYREYLNLKSVVINRH